MKAALAVLLLAAAGLAGTYAGRAAAPAAPHRPAAPPPQAPGGGCVTNYQPPYPPGPPVPAPYTASAPVLTSNMRAIGPPTWGPVGWVWRTVVSGTPPPNTPLVFTWGMTNTACNPRQPALPALGAVAGNVAPAYGLSFWYTCTSARGNASTWVDRSGCNLAPGEVLTLVAQ